jgi:hypothetical protein
VDVIEGRRGQPPRNPLRTGGLLRSVARRSRSDWPLVLAAWLLLACATSLITSAISYSESVTLGGFHKVIQTSPPATTAVRVYASAAVADLAAADSAIRPVISSTLGADRGSISLIALTDGLSLSGYDASDQSHQIIVGSYGDIEDHAKLTSGHWPGRQATGECVKPSTGDSAGGPIEAALSQPAAKALGLALGDLTTLTSKLAASRSFSVCVAGIYQPNESDRYWLGAGLELTGTQMTGSATTRGPFVVAQANLGVLSGSNKVTAEWRWLPNIEAIRPGDAAELRTSIAGLKDRVQAAFPGGYVWQETGLDDTLAAATKSLLVAQSSSLLLFAQFVVLAVYAILLVAGMLVERRRPEAALLRSRGASWPHMALLSMGEAMLLAVPAVAVAPFVAQAVVRLTTIVGPLAGESVVEPVGIDSAAIAAASLAGLGCVAVLTLPSLPGIGSLSGVRATLGRQLGKTLAQRLGLDLILAFLAAVALWQLQSYGSPLTTTVRGDLGIDPLLVLAPAIGLLAGALLATRLVPRLGELGERLLERARGLSSTFLARQMGRRPLRYTRLALLLMLAVALGTFAAAFAATWAQSQAEQAAYQTGADVRANLADHPVVPAWALGPLYRSVPGVNSVAAASRGKFDVGRDVSSGQLLAVEPGAAKATSLNISGTEGLAGNVASISGAATDRPLVLPGTPTQLRVTLALDLTADAGLEPIDQGPLTHVADVGVSAIVTDANGVYRIDGGSIIAPTTDPTAVIDLKSLVGGVAYRPTYPLALLGIELHVSSPVFGNVVGTVDLRSIESQDESVGAGWQAVSGLPGAAGWGWSRVERGDVVGYTSPPGRPGVVELGSQENQARPISGGSGVGAVTLRYVASPGSGAMPAIANAALLDATGARTGDTILISRGGYESRVKIVAVASIFPTLDPSKPFLILDISSLARTDYENFGNLDSPRELWLSVEPGRETEVATALGGGPYSASSVLNRLALEESGRADPISLGVIGALFLGAIAAAVLAAIGFLVTAAFMARERSGEMAVLRALGERPGTLVRMLAVEQALLLLYGLAGGIALGLLLGWLAIPFAWLTPSGTVPVPAPGVSVPWLELSAVVIPMTVALFLGAGMLIRLAMTGSAAAALRRQDVAP